MEPAEKTSFRYPPPTRSEQKLRSILVAKKMPFKSQVIWYSSCKCYTPDLLIGEKLIVEVDGKIHDQEFHKAPDRIRQRALKNMGYEVIRVKNEQIVKIPSVIAEEIIQKYYELFDSGEKTAKIRKLKNPSNYEPIPKEINKKLKRWVVLFSNELNEERWTVDYFRQSLAKFHPGLVTNQCAMEQFMLLLLGLNLHKQPDGLLDFEESLRFLQRSTEILRGLFGDQGDMAAIHLKNMYNISAPGFFKNLIFRGGPKINPEIISIQDKSTLNHLVDNFNKNLSKFGITVEPSEIKEECNAFLTKSDEIQKINFNWLREWINE